MVVDYSAKVRIYENINYTYNIFQNLLFNGSSITYAGAITDDHDLVVFGTHDSKTVYAYKFNGQ